jgi:hypothetical protein
MIIGHILLHDSFDIKRLGSEITDVVIGAAIHAPFPVSRWIFKTTRCNQISGVNREIRKIRPQVLRGIKLSLTGKKN